MSDFKDNRNTDMETANKLLHDLGEIDDRFVEKAADTNITVTSKGKRSVSGSFYISNQLFLLQPALI